MLHEAFHVVVLVKPVLPNFKVPKQVIALVLLSNLLNLLRDRIQLLINMLMLLLFGMFLRVHEFIKQIFLHKLLKFDRCLPPFRFNVFIRRFGILVDAQELVSDVHVDNAANFPLVDGFE